MFFMSFGSGGLCMACLVVCGFLGLFVFGLPGSGFCLGLGWALVWFSGLCTDCCSGWLLFWGWLGFCWFCLESLILAQDERWRRA